MEENYAMYLRKSRVDVEAELRGEGETLARHENRLLELAGKLGIVIKKIYKEIVSGESIQDRPKVQELLSDVEAGMWDGVLVIEVERLARGDTMDQGKVAKSFKFSNTKIITPSKTYDPNNEFDEEYFEFGLFMSRREYKTINRRLQSGRVSSVKEGKFVGSIPPFGYNKIKLKNTKGFSLEKNYEAKIVKIIYDLYAYENISLYEIVRRLNAMGLKPRILSQWSVASIKDILANPVYIGKIRWNGRKTKIVYKNGETIKTRPRNSEYILINGLHEPIIDKKTWDIVEAKRNLNNPPVKHNNVVQNPLCGIVICDKCGRKMVRRPYSIKDKEPTLYCNNPECDNISSKLYIVEEQVIEGLRLWLSEYKFDYEKYYGNIKMNKVASLEKTIESLEEEIKKENDKLLKIVAFLEDGTYTKELFMARTNVVSENIKKLNNSVEEYRSKLIQEKEIAKEKETIIPKVENILDVYNLLETAEEKNNLLKTVLSQITYLKTEKAIKKDSDPTNFIINLYPKISKKAI